MIFKTLAASKMT